MPNLQNASYFVLGNRSSACIKAWIDLGLGLQEEADDMPDVFHILDELKFSVDIGFRS